LGGGNNGNGGSFTTGRRESIGRRAGQRFVANNFAFNGFAGRGAILIPSPTLRR
jgi:hypothetical protein